LDEKRCKIIQVVGNTHVTEKGGIQKNREDTAIAKPLLNYLALTERAQCNLTTMQHTTQAK